MKVKSSEKFLLLVRSFDFCILMFTIAIKIRFPTLVDMSKVTVFKHIQALLSRYNDRLNYGGYPIPTNKVRSRKSIMIKNLWSS